MDLLHKQRTLPWHSLGNWPSSIWSYKAIPFLEQNGNGTDVNRSYNTVTLHRERN